MERIAITGVGIITGSGQGFGGHHQSLLNGGEKFVSLKDVLQHYPFEADEIHSSCLEALVSPVLMSNEELAELVGVKVKDYDRHQLFSLIAAKEAVSCLSDNPVDMSSFACIGAIGGDGLLSIFETVKRVSAGRKATPRDNLKFLSNLFVGYITQEHGLGGASHVHGTACAASMHAINDLVRMIKLGETNGGVVVGTEAAISSIGIGTFMSQRALGNGLAYQANRTGFVMGEGAASLVLEKESAALARGAHIYGYILGYGETSDAVKGGLVTDPSPTGAARSMKQALQSANLSLSDIDLVKTHGTATPNGDLSELKAIQLVEGDDQASRTKVMSFKSYFGHLLGAAGIAEIVSVLACMQEGVILPTRNLKEPCQIDPECDLVHHVGGQPISDSLDKVLCNGFGFGGTNATIILGSA
jgi:3-oxoacyl-[acyl-carrier-protein] synthase II